MNNNLHCYGLKFIMRIEHRDNFCRVEAIGKARRKRSCLGIGKRETHSDNNLRPSIWEVIPRAVETRHRKGKEANEGHVISAYCGQLDCIPTENTGKLKNTTQS